MQQAEVIQNHENKYIRNIPHGVSQHRKFKLGGGQVYNCQSAEVSENANQK
jgi:hypothetical protein